MGLDIAFSRELALKAGIEVQLFQNGTDAAVEEARENGDYGYAAWLSNVREHVRVPGMDYWVDSEGSDTDFVVRANKWGSTYAPLTQWLAANNIDWTEF